MSKNGKGSVLFLSRMGVLLSICTLIVVGCRQKVEPPNNLQEAQDVYQKTSWYWSHAKWDPHVFPGFEIIQGGQILMVKTNDESLTRIVYDELEPKHGLFCFRGAGILKASPRLQPPLFELQSGYTTNKPNAIIIVGIVRDRMFWVEADGENKEAVFSNACLVATAAFNQLRTK